MKNGLLLINTRCILVNYVMKEWLLRIIASLATVVCDVPFLGFILTLLKYIQWADPAWDLNSKDIPWAYCFCMFCINKALMVSMWSLTNLYVRCRGTYFCSWNLWPTLSECFRNFSEHLEMQDVSLEVKLLEVKSLTQSSKHLDTKLEYNLMKSFICFCSTTCWNSCCSFTFNWSIFVY